MANNEFGDFQTNEHLSQRVVRLLAELTSTPATIVEPTCGRGNLVQAALAAYPRATVHGLEINPEHVRELERRFQFHPKFVLHRENYFDFDWPGLVSNMVQPVWVIGNPPWVTNSHLMKIDSANLPKKSPQAGLRGFDAQTGKSNFDISESMIRDWLDWCNACGGSLAVICKMSVARKILQWWWKKGGEAPSARLYRIDAKEEFDVTVSAGVLVCSFEVTKTERVCSVFDNIDASAPSSAFGLIDGYLVSDASTYLVGRGCLGSAKPKWRSGLKHDAGSVLELRRHEGELRNGLGETVRIEPDFVYPLVKGSDLTRENIMSTGRFVVVPQRSIGDDVARISESAPKTWSYLMRHRSNFLARKSVIYRKGGDFSIFGVGDYSFMPWKVAIGALYKRLNFRLVGPVADRPVMFDDTVYFLGFETEAEARRALARLGRDPVRSFLKSMIFWDDMRPIKTEILNRVDLSTLEEREAA